MIRYTDRLLILIICWHIIHTNTKIELIEWEVEITKCAQANELIGKSFPATIPSNIHLDLINNQLIQQPWHDSHSISWIQQCVLKYSNNFILTQQQLTDINFKIIFQGIDTFSTITINNHTIFNTNNAFIKYQTLVQNYLLIGSNVIQVNIYPHHQGSPSCKPYYQLGTQFNPRIRSMGIWKKAYLVGFKMRIDYVWVRNRYITPQKAILNFAICLEMDPSINLRDYAIVIDDSQKILGKETVTNQLMYIDIQIKNPSLWWPNGIGNPHVYHFQVKIIKTQNIIIQSHEVIYGIRSVQLVNNEVHINGYPIYIKGSTYYPPDMLYPRVTTKTIQNIINTAVESNFNMLRVWGGGQYESDEFYQLCSKKGLMVFQDLMFMDKQYPLDTNFIMSIEEQLKYNIKRIRNYPCLTIWSANSYPINKQNPLFKMFIPKVLQYQNPQIPFIQSIKDMILWNQPIDGLNGQFSIEGLPVWSTIKFIDDDTSYELTKWLFSHPSMVKNSKQKEKQYGKPSLTQQLHVYQTGIIQAYQIELLIKAQRASKPKNWGTMYSIFNDIWPTTSPSTIDYFQRWKPAQYIIKRYYPSIAIYYHDNHILVINDKLDNVQAITSIKLIDFHGKLIFNQTQVIKLSRNEVKQIFKLDSDLTKGKEKSVVLVTQITASKNDEMTTTHFFAPLKQLQLPKSQLKVQYHINSDVIILKATNFIKSLQIFSTDYVQLSDNYFDLIPGKIYKVNLKSKAKLSDIKSTIKYRSYKQIDSNQQLKVQIHEQL